MKLKRNRNRLHSIAGAVDTMSVLVGVLVIGILGAGVGATIFAVIPWSQDNTAKARLNTVVLAEESFENLSPSSQGKYGSTTQLLATSNLTDATGLCALPLTNGKGYMAIVKSASGTWWSITDSAMKPVVAVKTAANVVACFKQ